MKDYNHSAELLSGKYNNQIMLYFILHADERRI
jgi:hypothetical protein